MEGLPPRRWPQAGNGLRGDVWSGFDLTGLEGDAEPPMNPRGGQGPVKTKSYTCLHSSEPSDPADEAGTQRRRQAERRCLAPNGVPPAKGARGRPMKPNPEERLEAPGLSRGEDIPLFTPAYFHASYLDNV
ncbi:MAG: hypothetical protein ACP5QI_06895 [Candidatus Bathyarchaeia archaeon]